MEVRQLDSHIDRGKLSYPLDVYVDGRLAFTLHGPAGGTPPPPSRRSNSE